MSQKTLKDILKPPFYDAGLGLICDGNTRLLDAPGFVPPERDKNDSHLAHIRGWGFFGYLENGEEIQDSFAKFVVDALNEKWERDNSEHEWQEKQEYAIYYQCSKCGNSEDKKNNYCPHCGQRLLSQEKIGENQ